MIEMRKVFFSYKAEDEIQVSDLNIEIKAGEFVLLCGKSGCGKTTILKMINGLIPHAIEGNYQGKVTIYNKSVREMETFEIAEAEAEADFKNRMDYVGELVGGEALTAGDLAEMVKTQQFEISILKKENLLKLELNLIKALFLN